MSDNPNDRGADANLDWNETAVFSADPAQRAQIKTFCSVTGADADSALHVLEAHNWDMDRSVMFFLDGGTASSGQSGPSRASAAPSGAAATHEPINLDAEEPASEGQQHPSEAAPPNEHEVRSTVPQAPAST